MEIVNKEIQKNIIESVKLIVDIMDKYGCDYVDPKNIIDFIEKHPYSSNKIKK
jgi:hypothetical protein